MAMSRNRWSFWCLAIYVGIVASLLTVARAQDKSPAIRQYDPDHILAPVGYTIEAFATKLNFPTDIAFGDDNRVYVAEAGGHGFGSMPKDAPPPQIVELRTDGSKRVVYDTVVPMAKIKEHDSSEDMPEGLIPPVTGLTWHEGKLYVSHRSRYSVLDPDSGEFKTIVNGLPCWGEFVNAKPIFDPQGKMVFFVSTQGNSGVIERHWMMIINMFGKKKACEVPGEDVELAGHNFAVPVEDPDTPKVDDKKMTGVFVPLGTKTEPGQVIGGREICNGAFYRCNPDGSGLGRIAWGFRSSFGYAYSPDGRLFCTHNGANPMPPRGLWFDYETIYEVVPNAWYGWPDFFSGIPITHERFAVRKGEGQFVLTTETHRRLLGGRQTPRQPLARLTPHSAVQGMVFGRREFGMDPGDVLIAEMGTIVEFFKGQELYPPGKQSPKTPERLEEAPLANVPLDARTAWPGFKVRLVDLDTGRAQDFLRNRVPGPATAGIGHGLERPLQLAWGPDGSLYVVDFGVISMTPMGLKSHGWTGAIWRVSRSSPRTARQNR